MDIHDSILQIRNTPATVWEKIFAKREAREKELDDKCQAGDHQGTLSHPIFSGADIWWRCSRCGKYKLQVGGNQPIGLI